MCVRSFGIGARIQAYTTMAAAIGHADPNPLPIHGSLWFDVRRFGVSPSNSASANRIGIQAAHDAAAAALAAIPAGRTAMATVFIPGAASAYMIDAPIFVDGNSITFRGEGAGRVQGTTIQMAGTNSFPPFILGVSRTAGGVVPNATYRPDLWNGGSAKLDTTVVTGANQRWGLRTNGDLYLMSHGSSLTHGSPSAIFSGAVPDHYTEMKYLAVDFAIEGFASGRVPAGFLFGLGGTGASVPTAPAPFLVSSGGSGLYNVYVAYQTAPFAPATTTHYTFSSGAATGVQRISFQVDLVGRTFLAWVNGVQVAVTGAAPPAGVTLNANNVYQFSLNAEAATPSNADFAIYGLNLSQNLRYANNGTGTAQVAHPSFTPGLLSLPGNPTGGTFTITYQGQTTGPISATAPAATIQAALQGLSTIGAGNVAVGAGLPGVFGVSGVGGFTFTPAAAMCDGSLLTGGTIGDAYRYYPATRGTVNYDAYSVGFFGFTENPSTAPRHLAITGNTSASASSAFLINGTTFSAPGSLASEIRFVDLEVDGAGFYGTAIMVANVLYAHYEGIIANGRLWAVADIPLQANYVNYFKNCTLVGLDSSYFGYFSDVQMDSVIFPNNGRSTLRLTGSSINMRHCFVVSTGNPQDAFCSIYDGTYGGRYFFDDLTIDNEGVSINRAVFYAETCASTFVELGVYNCYFGEIGSAPIFMLRSNGTPPNYPGGLLDADFLNVDAMGALIDVDGPSWYGEVRNTGGDFGSDVVNQGTFPGRPRVHVLSPGSKLPPKYGQSLAGCSRIPNNGWIDGQYSELRVAADGIWGSTTPPQWVGLNPIQAVPNSSIAAYAIDHTTIAATLSGQASSFGYPTTHAAGQMAEALFGGTAVGTSASLTIGGNPTGGTFTLSYGGQTTAGIAWNAAASAVQSALQALSSIGVGNVAVSGGYNSGFAPYTIALTGSLANLTGGALGIAANASGLTGGTPAATLAPIGLPGTWYVGLSLGGARKPGQVFEPASAAGYARVALANSPAGFTAASAGSKASAAAVTFPIASKPYTVQSIFLADAPAGGNVWAAIQLAQPLTVGVGSAPTIPAGGLTFGHIPLAGTFGTLTDYGWGKLYDLVFRGTAASVPVTWYAALSTAALTRSSAGPTEPSGNGYARVGAASNAGNWAVQPVYSQAGDVQNAAVIAFPTPTGSWGNIVATALCDAATGGNAWLVAGLTLPIAPASGSTAPAFAAGAFMLAMA